MYTVILVLIFGLRHYNIHYTHTAVEFHVVCKAMAYIYCEESGVKRALTLPCSQLEVVITSSVSEWHRLHPAVCDPAPQPATAKMSQAALKTPSKVHFC